MFATSPRPRRSRTRPVLLVLVAVLALLGTACGRQVVPKSYGDTTKKNFAKGCQESSKSGGIDNPQELCACTYAGLVKTIPFSEFKKLNEQLSKKPGPLPEKFLKVLDTCKADATTYTLPAPTS